MASATTNKSTEQLADQSVPPAVQSSAGGIDVPQPEPPRPKRKAVFGLGQNIRNPRTVNPFDYEQKYEEDDYGSELGSNARFWRVLLDEGQAYDAELIEGWRDTLDVLLVFALQPDYAAISVSLLAEIVSLQRALADGTPSGRVPRSSLALNSVTATALDYWCNAFWFISLTLSLSAALMSVLIKQWLQAYSSNVSGTPRKQALVRQFRLIGIERWNVPLIVGLLPMLLHLSLLLFFVGLSLYLFTFDTVIASIVAGLAISYGYAAFQESVTATSNFLRQYAHRDAPDVLPSASRRAGASALSEGPSTSRGVFSVNVGTLVRCLSRIRSPASLSRSREADAVAFIEDSLTVECLNWVFSTSSNPTVASITVQAVSGLSDHVAPLNNVTMFETLKHDILSCFRRASEEESSALTLMFGQERKHYHPAKSCTLLAVFLWNSAGRAHDYALPVFERPLTMEASSLYTLCAFDSGYKDLVKAAVRRLLEDLRLHMLRRALETYASETLTSSKFHSKRQIVSATGFDEVDDANIGFLARYLDEVPREHAWALLKTVNRIIAWPGLSLQTLHLFFYIYYLQGGQSTADIPSSSRLVHKINLDPNSPEATAARQHIDYLFHASEDQTIHLAWYWSIYVLVAATDPHRTSPLRPAM
ncbi:uncharacterized protein SCHCODRAFT_02590471 [Schizophyllum commune H4-8]|uniref:DUF6535 domain-containing protein n=1 Tax=Schizophyllum commune (strain H4-8 / FGSC 9210) TaxID=578458 RepID=D8QH22_SCHCM|nr:uncharacterized protein SCHCODRAFT_02590471 [Schizophyllum commune H4-8]KAI5886990.1 hypothetical protein SCHCODRAFT_02590471 [Schizophyllum commune H4-8]